MKKDYKNNRFEMLAQRIHGKKAIETGLRFEQINQEFNINLKYETAIGICMWEINYFRKIFFYGNVSNLHVWHCMRNDFL